MSYSANDLNKMSDEELLQIIHGGEYLPPTSPKNTHGTYDYTKTQAKIILHNRQKKSDKSLKLMTLSILILTIVLTIFSAFAFFDWRPFKFMTEGKPFIMQLPLQKPSTKNSNNQEDNAQPGQVQHAVPP